MTYGAACGTSLAIYKTNIVPIQSALAQMMALNPVTFDWKATGTHDIGLIADATAAVNPLFGAYDSEGNLYNFRDRPVLATLIAAFQEYVRMHP